MAITSATGGIITNYTSSGTNYRSHTFLTSGQLQVTASGGSGSVDILIVGGGGGGSLGGGGESITTNRGNGGGGGGFISITSYNLITGSWNITIGEGGKGGTINSAATVGTISSFASSSNIITGSYGGYGGQPVDGEGASGGGSFPTGAAAILNVNTQATALASSSYANGAFFQLTGSTLGKFYVTASTTQIDAAPIYYVVTGSSATLTVANIAAKINTLSSTFGIVATGSATTLQLSASIGHNSLLGNTFTYVSASIIQPFAGATQIGFDGGNQSGKSGAGGGGAASEGTGSYTTYDDPFTFYNGGNGGLGKSSDLINGTGSFYAAGGGGGGWVNVGPGGGGTGGSSIGGNGGSGVQGAGGSAAANTGAGGGGGALSDQSSNWGNGGDGGSGIVVVRYTV